jgi:hypothetical protein
MAFTPDPAWQPKLLMKSTCLCNRLRSQLCSRRPEMAEAEWIGVGDEQSLDPHVGCWRQEMVEPDQTIVDNEQSLGVGAWRSQAWSGLQFNLLILYISVSGRWLWRCRRGRQSDDGEDEQERWEEEAETPRPRPRPRRPHAAATRVCLIVGVIASSCSRSWKGREE